MQRRLEIEDIVLIGRTFEEYSRMFNLADIRKSERILDVASGVSSFCAEANALGYNVTASDRIYHFSAEEIEEKCANDLELTMEKVEPIKDLYKWEFFKDIASLKAHRRKAYKTFVEDFKHNTKDRYVNTEYPENDFGDKQFDVTLISHFLFMYDEYLDYEFHKEVIKELIRITSKEIRIFPLVNLKGQRSLFVDRLIDDRSFSTYKIQTVKVDYEFVKGGNEMLLMYLGKKEF